MPTLLEVMEGIKAQRLEAMRKVALDNRVKVLHILREEFAASQLLHAVIPEMGDLVDMEPFRTVIMNTPPEETATAALFSQAMEELPILIDKWRKAKDSELLAIMKCLPDIGDDATESILRLASTFFSCKMCTTRFIGYPQVLVHSCFLTKCRPEWGHIRALVGSRFWHTQYIEVPLDLYMSAKSVLELCGRDPKTASAQDIRDLNPLFECLDCKDKETSSRLFMRYGYAVRVLDFFPYSTYSLVDCRFSIP
jgi:hypothetical protein